MSFLLFKNLIWYYLHFNFSIKCIRFTLLLLRFLISVLYKQTGSVRVNAGQRTATQANEVDDDPFINTINNVINSLGIVNPRSNLRPRAIQR